MRLERFLLSAAAAVAVLVVVDFANAETATLQLKRLEGTGRSSYNAAEYAYRATRPQQFFAQFSMARGARIQFPGNNEQTAAFKGIVTKEPKYDSEFPFRGVAKLGSQEYAFVLDAVSPEPKVKDTKPENDKRSDQEESKATAKKAEADSPLAMLAGKLAEALSPAAAETISPQAVRYNRLYFDFNHNGDLSDDKPVEAEKLGAQYVAPASYSRIQFPRVDVAIDAGGTKLDYSFILSGYVNVSRDFSYGSIMLNAASYREGEITLEGKKHHVAAIDFNSNGRFDDETKVSKQTVGSGGQIYPEQGDILLVDPDAGRAGLESPYDATSGSSRHYTSKLVNIDGSFYDLKISPAGDKITLSRSAVALGNVSNPNDRFRAVIYSDQGFLKIQGNKGTPIAVPVGLWRLLSYTIDRTGAEVPGEPAEKKKDDAKSSSLLEGLAKSFETLLGGSALPGTRYRNTVVAATATAKYQAVEVRKDETVELPFGPPYKPTVSANYYEGSPQSKQLSLGMSLIGSAGEVCTSLMVDGHQPMKPKFTITDPKGEAVQQGNFEYG